MLGRCRGLVYGIWALLHLPSLANHRFICCILIPFTRLYFYPHPLSNASSGRVPRTHFIYQYFFALSFFSLWS
ncbi:hypothetical protein BKA82DRAFT_4140300 [Pisolithus tinctorius]|nr:hypothetical protein BKA82DRAFT_4140300 [Pisolithus tinctorius]